MKFEEMNKYNYISFEKLDETTYKLSNKNLCKISKNRVISFLVDMVTLLEGPWCVCGICVEVFQGNSDYVLLHLYDEKYTEQLLERIDHVLLYCDKHLDYIAKFWDDEKYWIIGK